MFSKSSKGPLLESGQPQDNGKKSRDSGADLWSIKSVPKAQLWECGQARQDLRHEYNGKELGAANLMKKYDKNRNRELDDQELKVLLQDFNEGMKVKDDDLKFILKVADINKDGGIKEKEVHTALRTWYAYRNMPNDAISAAIRQHDVKAGKVGAPHTFESLKALLESLNDSHAVKDVEVEYVESAIHCISGHKDSATEDDIKRGIAVWYLHMKRGPTSFMQKLRNTSAAVNDKISDLNVAKKLREGECDFRARGTMIIMAMVVVIVVFLPLMHMMVASSFPSSWHCEQPVLSSMLWWTGCLGVLLACALLNALLVNYLAPHRNTLLTICWAILGIVGVIEGTLYVVGTSIVTYTTAGHCGTFLWHYSHFAFVLLPLLIAVLVCCGLPILYCYMGSEEFITQKELDDQLHLVT